MAVGTGMGFDFSTLNKSLEKADKMLEKIYNRSNQIKASTIEAFKQMSNQGVAPFVENLKKPKRILEEIGKLKITGQNKMFEGLRKEASRTIDEINKLLKALQKTNAPKNKKSGISAISYADKILGANGVKSIDNMRRAIQQLEKAQNRQNLRTQKGRENYEKIGKSIRRVKDELDKATRSSDKMKKSADKIRESHSRLMDIGSQLQRKLALIFSVSQITSYMNKLVDVRKEFELQQKSLSVLLQNKDAADKLWNQTLELAVKSPFRVKELITYTKQLSAYRIESEKLHDTTKRLADISAGLGVDMQRLILAYGQVKAASFLRGTELRQFTEAGIPMLEELAKYFSEIEGRAVSVGDVFERISKRLVSFSDVSAVINKMTDAGGLFYNMQEEQSKTLSGMISNLHDSIDIMMNAIGEEHEGTLKDIIIQVQKLVKNWREVAEIADKSKYAFLILIGVMLSLKVGSSNLAKALFGLGNSASFAERALNGLKTVGRGLAVTAGFAVIAWAIAGLTKAYLDATKATREAARLRKELDKVLAEDVHNVEKSANAYKDLYSRIYSLNEGSKMRKDLIAKMNSEYGQYLNFVVDENTKIEQLANAYDDVVKRMKEKAAMSSFEKGMQKISDVYTDQIVEAKDEFYELFRDANLKSSKDKLSFIIPTKEEVDDIYSIIQQRAQELKDEDLDGLKEQSDLIQKIVKEYYGEEFYLSRDFNESIKLFDIIAEKKKKEKELDEAINVQYKETLGTKEQQVALEKLHLQYELRRKTVEKTAKSDFEMQKELANLAKQEKLDVIDLKVNFNILSKEAGEREKYKILKWATDLNQSINDILNVELKNDFSEEEISKVLINEAIQREQSTADYIKSIKSSWEQQNEIIKEQISLQSEGLDINEKDLELALRKEELYRRTLKLLGVEIEHTERLSEESRNAINNLLPEKYRISLEQAYNGIDKIITDLQKEESEHLKTIEQINEIKNEGLPYDEQALKNAEEAYWWTKKRLDLIDPKTKTPIAEKKVNTINAKLEEKYQLNTIQKAKDEVTLLSEANSEKEKAIAYEQQLNAQKSIGHDITEAELNNAKKDVEQYTLLWKLLGGFEEGKSDNKPRSNSLYDERIKVIDDMNKKYQELNKTLDKSTSLQGAFDAYIDAFADAFAEISWVPSNVRQMSAEDFAKNVLNFPNEDDIVKFLDKLSKEPMKAFEKIKVELAKGEYVMDINVRTKQDVDKEIIDSIEEMFGEYEISLDLEKLNIPPDMAKRLFGINLVDLNDIRDEIEQKLSSIKLKGGQEDLTKNLEEQLKKVEELEQKALQERLKRYSQFLVKGQSERVRIKLEELRELEKLEEDYDKKRIEETDYKLARQGIESESKEKLDKLEWDEFQNSSLYIQMFEDLETASTSALNKMREKLIEMRESLSELDLPSELKAINEQIEKIDEEAVKRNPIKGLATSLKGYIQYLKERKELERQIQEQRVKEENAEKNVKSAELDAAEKQVEYEKSSKSKQASQEEVQNAFMAYRHSQNMLIAAKDRLDAEKEVTKELEEQQKKGAKDEKTFKESAFEVGSYISQYANALPQIAGELENVFGVMSDGTKDTIDSISTIAGGVGDAIQGFASGDYVQTVTGVAKALGGIFQIGDKKKEREIKRQQKLIEELGKQYEKLEEQIEKAYTVNDLKSSFDESMKNLEEQIAAREKMIAAEEDKKKTDNERIKQWKEEIAEIEKQKTEALQSQVEELGGTYDFKSAAREFVDAWLDAFNESGNGLKGFEKQFNDFYMNIVRNQAVTRGASKILEPMLQEIDKALEGDFMVDKSENSKIQKAADYAGEQFNNFMMKMIENWGNSLTGQSNVELSGLQRGIQGVTEDTAEILASYLNSIRFFVSEQSDLLKQLVALQNGNNQTENPMVAQLKLVVRETTTIKEAIQSVIQANHKNGGSGIRVFID